MPELSHTWFLFAPYPSQAPYLWVSVSFFFIDFVIVQISRFSSGSALLPKSEMEERTHENMSIVSRTLNEELSGCGDGQELTKQGRADGMELL